MAQPVKYARAHAFSQDELGRQDGSALDNELDLVATTLDQIRYNLGLIQLDEGGLRSGIVSYEALSEDAKEQLLAGFNAIAAELTAAVQQAQDNANTAATAAAQAVEAKDSVVSTAEAVMNAIQTALAEETDRQLVRIGVATDQALSGYGISGVRIRWTLSSNVASGATVQIPGGVTYVVGHNHVRICWNGLELSPGESYNETGTVDEMSGAFVTLMPMKSGDTLDVWAVPLGRSDTTQIFDRINATEEVLADLSQRVVYRDDQSAGG